MFDIFHKSARSTKINKNTAVNAVFLFISGLQEPTHGKNAPLLGKPAMAQIAWTTFGFCGVFAILGILHSRGMFASEEIYMSARFALLVIMAVVNGFCVRARGWNIFSGLSQNPMFVAVALGIISCTVLSVYFGGNFLQLTPISMKQWAIVFGLSLIIIPINMIYKAIFTKSEK